MLLRVFAGTCLKILTTLLWIWHPSKDDVSSDGKQSVELQVLEIFLYFSIFWPLRLGSPAEFCESDHISASPLKLHTKMPFHYFGIFLQNSFSSLDSRITWSIAASPIGMFVPNSLTITVSFVASVHWKQCVGGKLDSKIPFWFRTCFDCRDILAGQDYTRFSWLQ